MTILWGYLEKYLYTSSANPTKWSNTLKKFVDKSNCLSVFEYFVGLAHKELSRTLKKMIHNLKLCTTIFD